MKDFVQSNQPDRHHRNVETRCHHSDTRHEPADLARVGDLAFRKDYDAPAFAYEFSCVTKRLAGAGFPLR